VTITARSRNAKPHCHGHTKRLRQEATLVILALHHVQRFNARMPDTGIDFSAPATLRKWPSLNKQRVSASLGARPYMISEGTLDECIQQFSSYAKCNAICTKFTPRRSLISSERSCRRTTSLSWRA
jgi:hypothetical protein